MKKKHFYFKLALALFIISVISNSGKAQNNSKRVINELILSNEFNVTSYYDSLKVFPHEFIPLLIKKINSRKKGLIGYKSKTKDSSPPFPYGYKGVRMVYLIESLLGGEDSKLIKEKSVYMEYYLVNSNEEEIVLKDLNILKSIYKNWWKNNKHKSFELLQIGCSKDRSPLKGSGYSWKKVYR